MRSPEIVKRIYSILHKHYPEMHCVVTGRHHSTELFDFKVKTRQWFGRTLAQGDGTLFGAVGKTVEIQRGTDGLLDDFRQLGFEVSDRR